MQDKAATMLDRATHMHTDVSLRLADIYVQLFQQRRKLQFGRWFVDDQPQGPIRRMRAHEDHRLFETRIAHAGHRNQKFAFQVGGVGFAHALKMVQEPGHGKGMGATVTIHDPHVISGPSCFCSREKAC